AWCKVDDTDGDMSIFNANGPQTSDPNSTAYLYHMEIRTGSNNYRWCVRNQEGETIGNIQETSTVITGDAEVIIGEWMHFACTYDKDSADANNLKMYINGQYVYGIPAGAVSDPNIGTDWSSGAAIGTTADGARPYKGQMDEFYMFNRALTPAEIATLASPTWLANGGFETGDITGWTEWNGDTAGTVDVNSSRVVEVYPTVFETIEAASGDYSCFVEGGQQYGITQTILVPAGTLVQVDALWAGTFTVTGIGWAELKALTHAPGAAYNLDDSDMGGAYTGDWLYIAKTDTYGLNTKADQTWDWEDAPDQSPVDGDQFISKGEVVIATKFGGFPVSGVVGGMVVDDIAVKSLPKIVIAHDSIPEDGHRFLWKDVNDITLSWTAGFLAASHDVYLGTDETAVTNATDASAEFMGNQVAVSYETETLIPGTTYFWRIDEVNGVDTWKGDVWWFEILPPMPDPVLWLKMDEPNSENARLVEDHSGFGNDGTMGSSDVWTEIPGLGGGIDFDGGSWGASGIVFDGDGNDLIPDMALSDKVSISLVISGHTPGDAGYAYSGRDSAEAHIMSCEAPTGTGLHFLTKMGSGPANWKWGAFEPGHAGYIFADTDVRRITVTVDFATGSMVYYLDDQVWAAMTNATGSFTSMTQFTVGRQLWAEFDGIMSDFRIYDEILAQEHVAEMVGDFPKLAKKPSPAHESTDNYLNVTLSWNPGAGANSHQVYFGTNESAVTSADTGSPVYAGEFDVNSYDPNGLELFKTYYWRVDEIDGKGGIMEGPVWQFDTIDYVMVEDFESYDNEGNDITAVWTDKLGLGDMQRLLMNDPCVSPINSMRLRYQIPYSPYWAITSRSFSPAQDWTVNGVRILTIHYYGDAANLTLPLFVTIG
ncbi:MAG: LamG domain-containing protein, partial [Planctomycetes bacterium]|nr:LamG domain-containing protein [Planctomycetota bacterium]